MSVLSIPNDIFGIIFDIIDISTILNLRLVCKQMNDIVHNKSWTRKFLFRSSNSNIFYSIILLDRVSYFWDLKDVQFDGLHFGDVSNYEYNMVYQLSKTRKMIPYNLIFKKCHIHANYLRNDIKINYLSFFDFSKLVKLKLNNIACNYFRINEISKMCTNLTNLSIIDKQFRNCDTIIKAFSACSLNKLVINYNRHSCFYLCSNSVNDLLQIKFLKCYHVHLTNINVEKLTNLQKLHLECSSITSTYYGIILTSLIDLTITHCFCRNCHFCSDRLIENIYLPNLQTMRLKTRKANINLNSLNLQEKLISLSILFQSGTYDSKVYSARELKKLTNLKFLEIRYDTQLSYLSTNFGYDTQLSYIDNFFVDDRIIFIQ